MRIAILTLPLHTNYGGILQAYALQTILQRMGHDVAVIDKKWTPFSWRWYDRAVFYGKQQLKKIFKRPIIVDWRHPSCFPVITSQVQPFIDAHIQTRSIQSWSDIREGDYDAIIVGSDQIWRPMYVSYSMSSTIEDAFLQFARNWQVRRIAYAPSFGVDYWEYDDEQTSHCRQLIRHFHAVSCREQSGVRLCTQHLGRKPVHVLDPTMLLSMQDYNKLCVNIPKREGFILTYIIDASAQYVGFASNVSKIIRKPIIQANSRIENVAAPLNERVQPPIEQWLSGFRDADMIITDSFHACVFAIMYNKPFLVLKNANRGTGRIVSLLQQFKQANRYIENISEPVDPQLCIERPNVIYEEWWELSTIFLKQALS